VPAPLHPLVDCYWTVIL